MPIYLVHTADARETLTGFEPDSAFVTLRPGLFLVEWEDGRSKLYHFVKRQLAANGALLVARLDEAPKFKGMAPGALKWVRARFA